ncbi:MAG: ATP-dependent DNA helicase RecG [Candidatus Omnitrophica bacterium]|nr:ATP-dependent DNA helicase RecG [Candidatus Omnitrophota bacterium]
MKELFQIDIRYVKGIGPKKAQLFRKIGIKNLEDLLYYFPKRYEDRTRFVKISELKEGQYQTIKARVLVRAERQSFKRRGFRLLEVVVGDETGKLFCVWFNQLHLKDYFKIDTTLILYGRVEKYAGRLQMNSPEFEIINEDTDEMLDMARITPVYPLPEGITQRSFRKLMRACLEEYLPKITDCLPYDIRSRNNLLNLAKSLLNIHFPENIEMQKQAYQRLSFEEFFIFQLPLALRKFRRKQKKGIAHKVEGELVEDFMRRLPFKLTSAQERVIAEIKSDMARPFPMQRLLQGEVGSGKTIVATFASLIAIQGGYQVAFMVPTEILANQHYQNIRFWIGECRLEGRQINIGLLTSARKEKSALPQVLKEGRVDLVIGTHALLEEEIGFKNLGLVVIDEQHKFGVGQRALLPQKGAHPDVLIMTATPIPRTLAITLYGDLDISVIDELPPKRARTLTLGFSKRNELEAYKIAKEQLRQGNQVYIVYPVIEESFTLNIEGARQMYEEFKENEFKEFRVGLIHGRLRPKEQEKIMQDFKEKKIDILVSTTVLEVGIDVPDITCMIVQYAERFGLAQLHQLRGRIGRGSKESFFILVWDALTPEANSRIEAMLRYSDGFHIAEEDLRIRGPGEFFGERQHGLSELKIANPLTQLHLLKKAREEALRLVGFDPYLNLPQNLKLKERLLRRFPEYERLVLVG